jgi:hypothetical protein
MRGPAVEALVVELQEGSLWETRGERKPGDDGHSAFTRRSRSVNE